MFVMCGEWWTERCREWSQALASLLASDAPWTNGYPPAVSQVIYD